MSETKKRSKLSTHEKLKKNPLPWIILLVLCMVLIFTTGFPLFMEWQEKKSEINMLETSVMQLQTENELKKREKEAKEIEFNLIAGPHLEGEKQLFPEEIDAAKIARILELYALQLENMDTQTRNSYFQLSKVSFGHTTPIKNKNYSSTDTTLSFTSDRENLETFVRFLQTGKLSERFKTGKEREQITLVDYKYLEDNLLPIAHIDALKIASHQGDAKKLGIPEFFEVQAKIIFFSQ
ncbi:hypothetical protein K9M59_01690 [Candidatus Gracilibacteria bacterium]|nr:hypothetical protein [Candidatus Gracilibacteria bacterium]MCF7819752.1 hypothetical protein [Candidatus Gracilibacteria bacterium]